MGREGEGGAGGLRASQTGLTNRDQQQQQQMSEQTKQVKTEVSTSTKVLVRAVLDWTNFMGTREEEFVAERAPDHSEILLLMVMIEISDEQIRAIAKPIYKICVDMCAYFENIVGMRERLESDVAYFDSVLEIRVAKGIAPNAAFDCAFTSARYALSAFNYKRAHMVSDEFKRFEEEVRAARRELSKLIQ